MWVNVCFFRMYGCVSVWVWCLSVCLSVHPSVCQSIYLHVLAHQYFSLFKVECFAFLFFCSFCGHQWLWWWPLSLHHHPGRGCCSWRCCCCSKTLTTACHAYGLWQIPKVLASWLADCLLLLLLLLLCDFGAPHEWLPGCLGGWLLAFGHHHRHHLLLLAAWLVAFFSVCPSTGSL